jgi:hypothetical protein
MVEVHITQISLKTASAIAPAKMIDDAYHKMIHRAARYLESKGLGLMEYHTQWGTGTTLWRGAGGRSELITREELIDHGF